MTVFDYEKKIWGSREASTSLSNSYCWSLKYGLRTIRTVEGTVIDLGCGAGAFTAASKDYRPDLDFVGLDLSERCIRVAQKRHQRIKFIQGNIERLPFKNESFGAVLANHLLEHLEKPEASIAEIYRILKPGGVLYSTTPLEGNWSSLVRWLRVIGKFRKNRLRYLDHKQSFSRKRYLELLKGAGLSIREINWSGHGVYQIIDAVYYPLLQFLSKKPEYLAEVEMLGSRKKRWRLVYILGKKLVNIVSNLESLLLCKLPGFIIHVEAVKNEI